MKEPLATPRILFLTHYTELYGANKSLLDIINGLKKDSVEVMVISPKKGAITDRLEGMGIPFIILPFYNNVFKKGNVFSFLGAVIKWTLNRFSILAIKRIIKKENIDIVHSNSSVFTVGVLASYQTRAKHIWHIREFGEEDYNLSFFPSQKKFLSFSSKSDKIIAISKAVYRARLTEVKPPEKVKIIYNGLIVKNKIRLPLEKEQKKDFVFSIIGKLQEAKGQLEAVQATIDLCAYHKNIKLLVVGDGEAKYTNKIKALVKNRNKNHCIEIIGFVENIDAIYKKTDVLLMCSKSEGMGRVTVEAMSWGIPVIGYHGGATPELVEEGTNGFLYKGGINELKKVMNKVIIMNNDNSLNRLKENNRKKAIEMFSVENYSIKFREVVDSLESKKKLK